MKLPQHGWRTSGKVKSERAKGAEKASCGETVIQKGVFGESVSSLSQDRCPCRIFLLLPLPALKFSELIRQRFRGKWYMCSMQLSNFAWHVSIASEIHTAKSCNRRTLDRPHMSRL